MTASEGAAGMYDLSKGSFAPGSLASWIVAAFLASVGLILSTGKELLGVVGSCAVNERFRSDDVFIGREELERAVTEGVET